MKRTMIFNNIWKAATLGMIFMMFSCNEEFPNTLQDEYGNREMGSSLNKVLIVVVDGLRGNAMMQIDPDNMRLIARNSLYTNTSLGDFRLGTDFTKETGLANLFTGLGSAKHQVVSNLSDFDASQTPTLFTRLKEQYDGFDSKAYTTNPDVSTYLFDGVDEKELLTTDAEVLARTKAAILDLDAETEMIVAHLSDIERAGNEYSYETNDPQYRQAILAFDAQMSDLITTLQERPTFQTENWLVVITSSVGGPISYVNPDDQTLFADDMRNTFTYFYSPRFARRYQARPTTNTMPFTGSGINVNYSSNANATSAQLPDAGEIDLDGSHSFTITFFVKQTTDQGNNYAPLLMKRNNTDNGSGWQFIWAGGQVQFGSNSISKINSAEVLPDLQWHVITLVANRQTGVAKIYTDGELNNETSFNTNNMSNTNRLTFGKKPGNNDGNSPFILCNLQVYDIAMTDEEVKELAGLARVVPENTPYYDNLMGYWPGYDDLGTRTLTDVTERAGDMEIVGELSWASFDEYVPFITPHVDENTYRLVPNLVDIPFFVYQWYGVLPHQAWGLDGQAWTPPYAVLEY